MRISINSPIYKALHAETAKWYETLSQRLNYVSNFLPDVANGALIGERGYIASQAKTLLGALPDATERQCDLISAALFNYRIRGEGYFSNQVIEYITPISILVSIYDYLDELQLARGVKDLTIDLVNYESLQLHRPVLIHQAILHQVDALIDPAKSDIIDRALRAPNVEGYDYSPVNKFRAQYCSKVFFLERMDPDLLYTIRGLYGNTALVGAATEATKPYKQFLMRGPKFTAYQQSSTRMLLERNGVEGLVGSFRRLYRHVSLDKKSLGEHSAVQALSLVRMNLINATDFCIEARMAALTYGILEHDCPDRFPPVVEFQQPNPFLAEYDAHNPVPTASETPDPVESRKDQLLRIAGNLGIDLDTASDGELRTVMKQFLAE